MMEFCHSQQEQYKLYFARIIVVGGKQFLEATFPSQGDQERILKKDETRIWIKYDKLEFYPPGFKNKEKEKSNSNYMRLDNNEDLGNITTNNESKARTEADQHALNVTKHKGKDKVTKQDEQYTIQKAASFKTTNITEDKQEDDDILWRKLTMTLDDTESWLLKEELKHKAEGSNSNSSSNELEIKFPDENEKEKQVILGSNKNYVKMDDWYDTLDDDWTFPYNQILYKDLKRKEYGSLDEINTYFDMMQHKYDLRGIRFLKEKKNKEATIFVEGHFKENIDFDILLQEPPQEDEGPWFVDRERFNEVKKTYDTIYKHYLPPEEDRELDENNESMVLKNAFGLETGTPEQDPNPIKEIESIENPKLIESPGKEKQSPDPTLLLYRELPMVKNEEMIIKKIREENDFEEYDTMTLINDLGKEIRYLKAQFKIEKSKSKALTKTASWKDRTWMITSMITLKLMTKKIWKEKSNNKSVTPQKPEQHKDTKEKDDDIIMKPSDAEIKILNKELDRVIFSCNTRMQPIVDEENEPDGNNKRKKNRSDTTYRTKFGATNPTEPKPKRKGASLPKK
ncbi:hypothetical protein RclHR1_06390012 [Rhizophagus clarus]|uniref:Uncharacterized protein n=1 Tax=Rhizophagus clarus TaxID=94130 RepID=A0A2Z6S9S5_9GLOM|nr:hypothetical protein RclHR1_06390012 [Rhizophagus clarus]GES73557.1 hypothetical protein RCL_jg4038.t1 [Rhizophagus clarus]